MPDLGAVYITLFSTKNFLAFQTRKCCCQKTLDPVDFRFPEEKKNPFCSTGGKLKFRFGMTRGFH